MCQKTFEEKLAELDACIEKHQKSPGPLMPTFHDAQEIFGAIPLEIQKHISKKLGVSVAHINGVVTFYSRFSLTPKGKYIISVCMGTACYVKGAQAILDAVQSELKLKPGETSEDGLFTLEATRCIGACALAPVYSINDEIYGGGTSKKILEDLRKIIKAEEEKNDQNKA